MSLRHRHHIVSSSSSSPLHHNHQQQKRNDKDNQNNSNEQQHNTDQAQLFFFLRAFVWGVGSPSSSTHRKMLLLEDENSQKYKTPQEFLKKTHLMNYLNDFVNAQRGRLVLKDWTLFESDGACYSENQSQLLRKKRHRKTSSTRSILDQYFRGDDADEYVEPQKTDDEKKNENGDHGEKEDEDDDTQLMKKVAQVLGPHNSIWLVVAVNFATPKLLRCLALHLLVGRLHPNTRIFIVCSKLDLQTAFDDISRVPTIARHACTTISVTRRSQRRLKLFALCCLKKLALYSVADRWSKDLVKTSKQTRDEWGGDATIATDSITTPGVVLIEDILTSVEHVKLVKFHAKYGNGPAFVKNVASALRFNYTTFELDLTGSECNDEPMMEFGPSLRATRKLQTLILRKCHLSDIGFADLGAAVRECRSLTALDLSENSMVTTDGILALAMALAIEIDDEEFQTLDHASEDLLSPAKQLLDSFGAKQYQQQKMQHVSNNHKASRQASGLSVYSNDSSATSASQQQQQQQQKAKRDYWSELGAPLCQLKKLFLRGCNSVTSTRTTWTHSGLRQFFRYLGRISTLEELDLSQNNFTEEDAINFAEFCVPPPKYGLGRDNNNDRDDNDDEENRNEEDVVDASTLYQIEKRKNQREEAELKRKMALLAGEPIPEVANNTKKRSRTPSRVPTRENSHMCPPSASPSTIIQQEQSNFPTKFHNEDYESPMSSTTIFTGLKLKILDFSGNFIGDTGAGVIVTRLAQTLSRINLSHCGLTARCFLYCGLAISRHPNFRELYLSYNDLSWEHAIRLHKMEMKRKNQTHHQENSPKNNNKTSSSTTNSIILEKFLQSDGGLREALENLPNSVSMGGLDEVSTKKKKRTTSTDDDDETTNDDEQQRESHRIQGFLDEDSFMHRNNNHTSKNNGNSESFVSTTTRKKRRAAHLGFGRDSQDESQFCWFVDRFIQLTNSVSSANNKNKKNHHHHSENNVPAAASKKTTFVLDVSHCVLATASVRTLFEGGILRDMVRFESLYLSGNYGVRGETISLLAGEVAGHPVHSQYLKDLGLDDVDPEVRERALIGIFLASSSSFEATRNNQVVGLEQRSAVTGQILKAKEKEKHQAQCETLFLRGPDLSDGMLYSIRSCPPELLPPLRILDLSRATITSSGAETICSVSLRLSHLEQLIVSHIWDEFFSPESQKIISLDEARDRGISILKHFADLIMDSNSLKVLDLSVNGIGFVGAKCLVGALKNQSRGIRRGLQRLVLSGNSNLDLMRDWERNDEMKKLTDYIDEGEKDGMPGHVLWNVIIK